ncbi:hypothetical protein KR018_008792 [Drosophila ironensis]|nr:hypothetical protein KR018_008792 [Drosophila ironensis]
MKVTNFPSERIPVWASCLAESERSTRLAKPTLWLSKRVTTAMRWRFADYISNNFPDTTPAQIEDCFKKFLHRPDIAIILINQVYADMIRSIVDSHVLPVPSVLEIPSKQQPYDAAKDSLLKRAHVSCLTNV